MTDVWRELIYTKEFDESVGGILLCGINPGAGAGGVSSTTQLSEKPSFFSDVSTANASYPYQRRIRQWFALWGKPLHETVPGRLERSISQANWLGGCTRFAGSRYTRDMLVRSAPAGFLPVLDAVRPRLLILFGVQHLPGALADRRLRAAVEQILGPCAEEARDLWFDRSSGKGRFRAVRMRFERCVVLGLPHPTPAGRALGDGDVAQLKDLVHDALAPYRGQ